MVHPHTQLRFINEHMGYGVFATQLIPKGTITYTKDALEVEVSPEQYAAYPASIREVIERYSFMDEKGIRVISWDHAKYVNHCCHCNTMSTGYGFEIAIRDILPGEEITDEYGMFNLDYAMDLQCTKPGCRGKVSAQDLDQYSFAWDEKVKTALQSWGEVSQPLACLLDESTLAALQAFVQDERHYRSVIGLRSIGLPA
ncbi:MAG: SET domain-containing protein [Lewinella sp.]|nr:SET domain-containing protein [Lewinella sp.]